MARPKNLYWDTCVFYRYILRSPEEHVADIEQFVAEAKLQQLQVHVSTIVFSELRPRFLRETRWGSVTKFFDDLGAACYLFDPNPNIMRMAGQIRDQIPTNPGDPNIEPSKVRVVGLGDAIHLATCLFLRDSAGCDDIVFHTFDAGKGSSWEAKCVPLLGFERWFPPESRSGIISNVCGLKREKPAHPQPDIVTGAHLAAMPPTSGRPH